MAGFFVAIEPAAGARDATTLGDAASAEVLAALASPRPETDARQCSDHATFLARAAAGQPLLARSGALLLAFDGRLDNRRDLRARLGLEPSSGDGDLLLAAYRHWGQDFPAHLVGDFALALWDGSRRQALVARDVSGLRPLIYCTVDDRFLAASSVGALVAGLGRAPTIHWPFLKDLCERRYERWRDQTSFRELRRLPAGWSGSYAGGRFTQRCFDRYEDRVEPFTGSASEGAEAFRAALAEAVRRRIEVGEPVALLTSGGLDSSAVACFAEDWVASGRPASGRLITATFDRREGADERVYFDDVANRCPHWPALRVPADDLWSLRGLAEQQALDEPEVESNRALVSTLAEHAVAAGSRILLGGHWGDQLLTSDAYSATSVLRDVPRADLGEELPHFRRRSRHPGWLVSAFAHFHPWIGESLRVTRGGWQPQASSIAALPSQAARLCVAHLAGGLTAATAANLSDLGRRLGVSWSFPYLDRDLVRLRLGMPGSMLFHRGINKFILRDSSRGVLPESVRQRRGSAYFDSLVAYGFRGPERDTIRRLLKRPRVVETGLVTLRRLGQLQYRCFSGAADAEAFRSLGRTLNVELWLRQWEGRAV